MSIKEERRTPYVKTVYICMYKYTEVKLKTSKKFMKHKRMKDYVENFSELFILFFF